jgi:hypothetical protein
MDVMKMVILLSVQFASIKKQPQLNPAAERLSVRNVMFKRNVLFASGYLSLAEE